MLAGVLWQCRFLVVLNLEDKWMGAAGAGRLAGVLGQCSCLTELNFRYN